jgi:hypothetical protein
MAPNSVGHSRLDLDEALAPIALQGPPCRAPGQRRGDGVIGRISRGNDQAIIVAGRLSRPQM